MLTCRRASLIAVVLVVLASALFAQAPVPQQQKDIESLVAAGKLEQAVEVCRAWIKQEAGATQPHFLLSGIYLQLGLWDRAQDELQTVLFQNPASTGAHVSLGDLRRLQGKDEQAAAEYQQALKISDQCVDAYAALARLAMAANNATEAAVQVRMALQIAPDAPALIALSGEVERLAGREEQAVAKYQQALQKDPACADALYGLAVLAQLRGAAGEAEAQQHWDRFLAAERGTERALRVKHGLVILAVQEIPSTPSADQKPTFSPDGKLIAFAGRGEGKNWEIFVMPADGSSPPVQITTGGGAMEPNWLPDGKRLLFNFFYDTSGKRRTFLTSLAGGEDPVGLTEDEAMGRNAIPWPGKDRLIYDDAWSLKTMKYDGSDKQKLPITCAGEVRWPSPSPDGKRVVYACVNWDDKRPGGPSQDLWIAALDGSTPPLRITPDGPATGCEGNTWAVWSPDGERLAFSSDWGRSRSAFSIYVMPPEPGGYRLRMGAGVRPCWSPDGTKLVCDGMAQDDPGAVFIMQLGGKRLPVVHP